MVLLRSNLPSAIGALTTVLVLAQHCGEAATRTPAAAFR